MVLLGTWVVSPPNRSACDLPRFLNLTVAKTSIVAHSIQIAAFQHRGHSRTAYCAMNGLEERGIWYGMPGTSLDGSTDIDTRPVRTCGMQATVRAYCPSDITEGTIPCKNIYITIPLQ